MDTQEIVIFHTNDIHSHFQAMPRIAAAMRERSRGYGPDQILRLDIGDHMDRMSPITEGGMGEANIAVMNACGYEAAVPGNNEGLSFSREDLQQLYGEMARFPVVCSNMEDLALSGRPSWLKPGLIIEKAGVKVGLIAVTAAFNTFYNLLGWRIADPLETVRKWAASMRPQVDILTVLSHVGFKLDQQMAKTVPGIDLILGGHTHHVLEKPLRIGSACICAAGYGGQYLGEIHIVVDRRTRQVREIRGESIPTDGFPADRQLSELIDGYRDKSSRILERKVADLTHKLPCLPDRESPLGNLLAEAVRRKTGAEIGIVNAGQLLGSLEEGTVSRGRLLEVCPSPINPCLLWLTGEQIVQALEQSLLDEYIGKSLRGFGFRGKQLGALCLDGLEVETDRSLPDYAKITGIRVGNEPLEADKEYLVGTLDMFTFGVGYPTLGKGRETKFFLPEFIRDLLAEALMDESIVAASYRTRWKEKLEPDRKGY